MQFIMILKNERLVSFISSMKSVACHKLVSRTRVYKNAWHWPGSHVTLTRNGASLAFLHDVVKPRFFIFFNVLCLHFTYMT